MSIDVRLSNDAKVREDLNLYSDAPLVIKVLTDLENRCHTFSIDIKVLKDLKRQRAKRTVRAAAWRSSLAGDRPPRYGSPHRPLLTVGRGPVPRHPTSS